MNRCLRCGKLDPPHELCERAIAEAQTLIRQEQRAWADALEVLARVIDNPGVEHVIVYRAPRRRPSECTERL